MDNNMLKWYGHVLRMDSNKLPKRTMACSLGRRRPEVECAKEVERVVGQWNITSGHVIDRQL